MGGDKNQDQDAREIPEGPAGDSAFLAALEQQAQAWAAQDLRRIRRVLESAAGPWIEVAGKGRCLSFLSNDYLGLAADPVLRRAIAEGAMAWGAGSGASALISGHLRCHAEAERRLADFVGTPAALLFITGYMANLAVVASLVQGEQDVVFSDRLNHASLIDGCRLSRARIVTYAHGDLVDLATQLAATPARRRLIVSDAVFSMDGDVADLAGLLALAEAYDALLVIDDAHGFGVLGPEGRGALAAAGLRSERLVMMGTLGKGGGLSGAFVAASALVIEHLIQHGRTYVFSTSPAPAVAAAVSTALDLIVAGNWRRERLAELRQALMEGSQVWSRPVAEGTTPIVPVVVGEADATMRLAARLAESRVLLAGIRPPTVPAGTARLRISLSAGHVVEDVEQLCSVGRAAGI
ncbi:MAG: 8-amino-7-oxononanoate synthase [Pseudomonadota bacterium]|nr:8-amino-7-oxononanoate synthase [Pseudomonadota bacterium]